MTRAPVLALLLLVACAPRAYLAQPIEFGPVGQVYDGTPLEVVMPQARAVLAGDPVPFDGVLVPPADLEALRRELARLRDTARNLASEVDARSEHCERVSGLMAEQLRDCRRRVAEACLGCALAGGAAGVVVDDVVGGGLGR